MKILTYLIDNTAEVTLPSVAEARDPPLNSRCLDQQVRERGLIRQKSSIRLPLRPYPPVREDK